MDNWIRVALYFLSVIAVITGVFSALLVVFYDKMPPEAAKALIMYLFNVAGIFSLGALALLGKDCI